MGILTQTGEAFRPASYVLTAQRSAVFTHAQIIKTDNSDWGSAETVTPVYDSKNSIFN
jgi:hypothetical protein